MFGGSERSGTGLMLMTADKRDAAEYANRKLFCEKRERIQVPRNFIDSGGGGGVRVWVSKKVGEGGVAQALLAPPPFPRRGPWWTEVC